MVLYVFLRSLLNPCASFMVEKVLRFNSSSRIPPLKDSNVLEAILQPVEAGVLSHSKGWLHISSRIHNGQVQAVETDPQYKTSLNKHGRGESMKTPQRQDGRSKFIVLGISGRQRSNNSRFRSLRFSVNFKPIPRIRLAIGKELATFKLTSAQTRFQCRIKFTVK